MRCIHTNVTTQTYGSGWKHMQSAAANGSARNAAAGASSTMNWMSAKAHLADPKELTGLAKAMQDAKQGGALSEKERTFEQKTKEKKEGKEDKDDTKKTNENPEENALDTKEDTTDPNTATSLRSDSKMIPTMPGQPG